MHNVCHFSDLRLAFHLESGWGMGRDSHLPSTLGRVSDRSLSRICAIRVRYTSKPLGSLGMPFKGLSGTRTVRQKRGVDAAVRHTEFSNNVRTIETWGSLAYFFSVFYRNQTLYRPCKMQQSKTACILACLLGLFLGLSRPPIKPCKIRPLKQA